jgi:hypothetical protein
VHDFGSYNFLRFNQEKGDAITFSRIGAGGSGYATAVEYNKDGIGAWALLALGAGGTGATGTSAVGDALQLGGAYTIANIGQIKAQYLGNGSAAELRGSVFGNGDATASPSTFKGNGDPFGVYQVAFNLSSVQNLSLEIGAQFPSASKAAGYAYQVAAIGGYTMDKTTFHFQVIDVSYVDDTYGKAGSALGGGVGLDYDLGDSVGVSADLRYNNGLAASQGADDGADAFTGFSIGLTKGFSNGLIGIGFEYATMYGFTFGPGQDKTAAGWAIPVRLEEFF